MQYTPLKLFIKRSDKVPTKEILLTKILRVFVSVDN